MPRRRIKIDLETERKIGQRVREARERMRYDQAQFSGFLGTTRDQLANIETGRTPLRYLTAAKLRAVFRVNLSWLGGVGTFVGEEFYVWPSPDAEKGRDAALFSEVAREVLGAGFPAAVKSVRSVFPTEVVVRFNQAERVWYDLQDRLSRIELDHLLEYTEAVVAAIRNLAQNLPQVSNIAARQMAVEMEGFRLRELTDQMFPRGSEEFGLTNDSERPTSIPVQPIMPRLRERLRKQTASRGSKTALAKILGVPRQSVNNWLSGRKEPGGETTLRLLHWVEQEEAKQKAPDSVCAPPGKTRRRKYKNEKPKSNPPKQ